MIVLPNSFEKYLSALRISVSISILKHGLQPRHIDNLRKIHIAEALLHKTERQSVDINKLCTNLLSAVKTIKTDFDFRCNANGNFSINKNLFTLLLLSISKSSNSIDVTARNAFLEIKVSHKSEKALSFVRALKGYSLFELKSRQSLIIIPIRETKEESIPIESEWEYIFNEFSVLNIYFID